MTVFEIVDREQELDALRPYIDAGEGPAPLVLEGEAGIGKSTLWLAGIVPARTQGLRVLSSRHAPRPHMSGAAAKTRN